MTTFDKLLKQSLMKRPTLFVKNIISMREHKIYVREVLTWSKDLKLDIEDMTFRDIAEELMLVGSKTTKKINDKLSRYSKATEREIDYLASTYNLTACDFIPKVIENGNYALFRRILLAKDEDIRERFIYVMDFGELERMIIEQLEKDITSKRRRNLEQMLQALINYFEEFEDGDGASGLIHEIKNIDNEKSASSVINVIKRTKSIKKSKYPKIMKSVLVDTNPRVQSVFLDEFGLKYVDDKYVKRQIKSKTATGKIMDKYLKKQLISVLLSEKGKKIPLEISRKIMDEASHGKLFPKTRKVK